MSRGLQTTLLLILLCIGFYFGYRYLDLSVVGLYPEYNEYTMTYNEINGLTVSNPVVVNGLSVGKVTDLRLIQDGKLNRIKVTIEVRKNIQVGDGTIAILQSSDFLGGKMIYLKLGPNNEIYPSGKEIKGELERTVAEEMEYHSQPIFENLDTTITTVSKFYDSNDSLRVERTKRNFNKSVEIVKKTVNEAGQNTGIIFGNLYDLKLSIDETKDSLSTLTDKIDTFRTTVKSLNLKKRIKEAKNSFKHLDAIDKKIQQREGTIGKFMDSTSSFYTNMDSLGNSLKIFIHHMDSSPGEFMPFEKKAPKKDTAHWNDKRFHY